MDSRPIPVTRRDGRPLLPAAGPSAARQLLDLPLPPNDSGAATVRGYLTGLLIAAWESGDGWSPFGNSGWQHDLYEPMTKAGLASIGYDEDGYAVDGDRHTSYGEASALVRAAIRELGAGRGQS